MPNLDEIGNVGVTVDRDWIPGVSVGPPRTNPDGAPEATAPYWGELEHRRPVAKLDTSRTGAGGVSAQEDNWKHRSKGMHCETCVCFVRKDNQYKICHADTGCLGRCRRHAPTLYGWPAVFENDWCFDFKMDEEKI